MVLSEDECKLIVNILSQLTYKLIDAKKILVITDKLQSIGSEGIEIETQKQTQEAAIEASISKPIEGKVL